MGLATITSHVANTILTAAALNNNFNALLNQLNGNIEAVNIAALAVTTAKINTGAVTGPKIAMGSDAQGDILIRGAANYQRLGAGTDGQVLRTQGAAANPKWDYGFATGAEVLTGTEAAKFVSPLTMISHQGVLKGWINFNGTGAIAVNDSFNVTSITDNGTGDYTVTWDTDFASANYAVSGFAFVSGSRVTVYGSSTAGLAAGSTRFEVLNAGAANTDASQVCMMAIGDR